MNRVQIFMHTLNAQMFTNNLIALHIFKNVIFPFIKCYVISKYTECDHTKIYPVV